jgi:hypothetical protein
MAAREEVNLGGSFSSRRSPSLPGREEQVALLGEGAGFGLAPGTHFPALSVSFCWGPTPREGHLHVLRADGAGSMDKNAAVRREWGVNACASNYT